MNKPGIIILTAALAAAGAAQAQTRWVSQTHDFGAFSEDLGAVDAVFELVNESDKPVRILDARATCGCTQPVIPKQTIEPGDTARLKVTYLATGRPGKFSKNIYVKTSDNPSEQRTLTVTGTVIGASATLASRYPVQAGPMRLRTTTAGFGEVTRGKLKTVFIAAYNQSADTLRPSLSGLPPYIDHDITPAAVAPGEQVQLALTLQTLKVPQWGITSEKFTFTPDRGAEPVEMDFFTIVSEDFSKLTPGERMNAPLAALKPDRVNLGDLSADAGVQTVEFTLSNEGKSPLMVRRVQAVDPAITDVKISSEKIKSGKSAKIKLTVDPAKAENGLINARVTIITNDPDNSLLTARVTAEIK